MRRAAPSHPQTAAHARSLKVFARFVSPETVPKRPRKTTRPMPHPGDLFFIHAACGPKSVTSKDFSAPRSVEPLEQGRVVAEPVPSASPIPAGSLTEDHLAPRSPLWRPSSALWLGSAPLTAPYSADSRVNQPRLHLPESKCPLPRALIDPPHGVFAMHKAKRRCSAH